MLETIKKFINTLKPDVFIRAPSRINLINPLDAVEGDFWMPSVAINGKENPLSTFVYIKKINSKSKIIKYNTIKTQNKYKFEIEYEESLEKNIESLSNYNNSKFKLFYACMYRLIKTNSYYKKAFLTHDVEIGIITTIPKQSGLGGSASIIIAFLYAISHYFGWNKQLSPLKKDEFPINKDIIAEMAAKVEHKDLKITAGYSDRYIICRGGLCFISYVGKSYHRKIGSEPLAICDRIDSIYDIKRLPIIICHSGVRHNSGLVHERLRQLYLQKDDFIIKRYLKLAELSWKSRFALMTHDWKLLGCFFNKNTEIMNEIMHHAGFKHGIGLANNFLIELIINEPYVYAVKLTGAGGGGSVFALVNPKKLDYVFNKWQEKLKETINSKQIFKEKFPNPPSQLREDLKNAQFFKTIIDTHGVQKL